MDRARSAKGVDIPAELLAAFEQLPEARDIFETLPPSHQREHTRYVAEAKRGETRERRTRRTVERLLEDRGTE